MNRSEFTDALEKVYGPALGHSLIGDLYLPSLRATALDALDAGADPKDVWQALTEETDMQDEAWAHRKPLHRSERRSSQKDARP